MPAETMRFVGAVLRGAGAVFRAEWRLYLTTVSISVAPQLTALAAGLDERMVSAAGSLIDIYLQLLVTFRALDVLGLAPPGYHRADMTEGRFGSAFVAGLVSTVGIGLGLLALVAPGVVLLALWSVWMPAIAGERLSAFEALRRSWRLCRRQLPAMLLLLLLVLGGFVVAFGLTLLPELAAGDAGVPVANVVIELLVSVTLMATPVLWAAAYRELRRLEAGGAGQPAERK